MPHAEGGGNEDYRLFMAFPTPHTYYQELDDEHDHLRMPVPPGTASL